MKEHPVFARFYERISTRLNDAGEVENRIELVSDAGGQGLEVGCGNGLNFEHYRAAAAPVPVRLMRGLGESLPFPDGTFDTVVVSLVLCSVADTFRVAEEMARVLRSDGEVRFLEHVRSTGRASAAIQDAIAPVWAFFAGNCHPNRNTVATLRAVGFEVTGRRFPFGPPSPARPHVLGVARRAGAG